jgi:hypothetical protein
MKPDGYDATLMIKSSIKQRTLQTDLKGVKIGIPKVVV